MGVVRIREGVGDEHDTENTENVLVELAGKLLAVIGQDIHESAILEDQMRWEGLGKVYTG